MSSGNMHWTESSPAAHHRTSAASKSSPSSVSLLPAGLDIAPALFGVAGVDVVLLMLGAADTHRHRNERQILPVNFTIGRHLRLRRCYAFQARIVLARLVRAAGPRQRPVWGRRGPTIAPSLAAAWTKCRSRRGSDRPPFEAIASRRSARSYPAPDGSPPEGVRRRPAPRYSARNASFSDGSNGRLRTPDPREGNRRFGPFPYT